MFLLWINRLSLTKISLKASENLVKPIFINYKNPFFFKAKWGFYIYIFEFLNDLLTKYNPKSVIIPPTAIEIVNGSPKT